MTLLVVDSRESRAVKDKFKSMEQDYKDLSVEIKALKTGDYENDYLVIENKSIDDFISSFTQRKTRKDKSEYERMTSQLKRLIDLDKPIKVILIHGKLEDAYSKVHPNSIRGMIASIICQGITVLWTDDPNWPEMIYRLHRKSLKYGADEVKIGRDLKSFIGNKEFVSVLEAVKPYSIKEVENKKLEVVFNNGFGVLPEYLAIAGYEWSLDVDLDSQQVKFIVEVNKNASICNN